MKMIGSNAGVWSLLTIALLMLFAPVTRGAELQNKLTWSVPTTRADGSAYNHAVETKNFVITADTCDGKSVTLDAGKALEYTHRYNAATNPCMTKYSLQTVDIFNLVSAKSPPISVTGTVSPPAPPMNIKVTVIVETAP